MTTCMLSICCMARMRTMRRFGPRWRSEPLRARIANSLWHIQWRTEGTTTQGMARACATPFSATRHLQHDCPRFGIFFVLRVEASNTEVTTWAVPATCEASMLGDPVHSQRRHCDSRRTHTQLDACTCAKASVSHRRLIVIPVRHAHAGTRMHTTRVYMHTCACWFWYWWCLVGVWARAWGFGCGSHA